MNLDPSSFNVDHVPKHELILDISETAQQLISQLRIQRESDIERVILTIDQQNEQLPGFITRNLSPDTSVSSIVVDGEVNRFINRAHINARVESDDTEVFMNISSGEGSDEPLTSVIIGGEELPVIDPPSRTELNRFLAGLFIKNKTGDYSAFDAMVLSNHQSTQRLLDALREVADEAIVDETYYLSTTLGPTADSIRFTEYDGTLHNAFVSVEHHAKASGLEISFTQQPMPMEIDEEVDNPEFMMQSLEGARTYAQDINGESKRVESTNEFLTIVRDFLREKRDSAFPQPDDLELQDDDDHNQLRDSVFSQPEIIEMHDREEDDQSPDDFMESDQIENSDLSHRATDYADPSLEINIEDLRPEA